MNCINNWVNNKIQTNRNLLHIGFPIKNPIMVKDYEGYE